MSPITHFLVGWTVTNSVKIEKRDRMLIVLAGVIPDMDGIGVVWDVLSGKGTFEFYQRYHHVFGHNLLFALIIAGIAFMLGVRKQVTVVLAFLSIHLHFLGDVIGSRGLGDDYWAIPYFWPFSSRDFYWSHQWPLNGWQNFAITAILIALTLFWAWQRGFSPLELLSERLDKHFVQTLRKRFGYPQEPVSK